MQLGARALQSDLISMIRLLIAGEGADECLLRVVVSGQLAVPRQPIGSPIRIPLIHHGRPSHPLRKSSRNSQIDLNHLKSKSKILKSEPSCGVPSILCLDSFCLDWTINDWWWLWTDSSGPGRTPATLSTASTDRVNAKATWCTRAGSSTAPTRRRPSSTPSASCDPSTTAKR